MSQSKSQMFVGAALGAVAAMAASPLVKEALSLGESLKRKCASSSRVDINVPYPERDDAKALGAKWDAANKTWYIPENFPMDRSVFKKWEGPIVYTAKALSSPQAAKFFQPVPFKAKLAELETLKTQIDSKNQTIDAFRETIRVLWEMLNDVNVSSGDIREKLRKHSLCGRCHESTDRCGCTCGDCDEMWENCKCESDEESDGEYVSGDESPVKRAKTE